jgi:nitroreductase
VHDLQHKFLAGAKIGTNGNPALSPTYQLLLRETTMPLELQRRLSSASAAILSASRIGLAGCWAGGEDLLYVDSQERHLPLQCRVLSSRQRHLCDCRQFWRAAQRHLSAYCLPFGQR